MNNFVDQGILDKKNSVPFVHLHVHTHYSLLKSSCTVSELVNKCVEYSQPAIAITDYGNMFGVLDLYFEAKEKGIKPILGLEIYLSSGPCTEKKSYSFTGSVSSSFHTKNPSLVLLAQNIEGYRNLCHINTIAYQKGFYYVPRVDYEVLKKYSSSLIALTGGFNGEVPQVFLKKGPDQALSLIKKLKNIYKDRLYLQLNRTHLKEWKGINNFLIEAGKITKVALTAGNDVHYLNQADHVIQDVLYCIGANRTLRDQERFKLQSDQFFLKNSKDMRFLFKDIPQVCDSTLEIHSRCHVQFQLKRDGQLIYHLPKLKWGEASKSPPQKLRELSFMGLNDRWKKLQEKTKCQDLESNKISINQEERQRYEKRLEGELKIIIDMGFADYFLIVYDFVHWAKKKGIPVGPGRGSGASSLVAYCLGITDLDPMPYYLLFERFLNPERISLPDFDIDFCQESRNRVIEYVSKKYGKDYVAQVMTYGRLQARAAIRDVGRVLGMSYAEVDQVVKLIPERLGITLDEAVKNNHRLNELMEADPQIDNLINLARQIEGLIRHVSIHAAGVIIADHPIISFAPLYRGTEGENVIQCDLSHSKKMGLVKFDFLGLKTLTQVHSAFKMIEQNQGKKLSIQDVSLEDQGIYEIMCEGDTKGIFQFEGEGITDLIIKAQPSCFEDIVAINALFRPGPMDMIPSYLARKKGKVKVEYLFSDLESLLKETYGIIVYQEQVLLIAAKIAGYSYGEADVLRRAMGEKKTAVMKKQKNRFLNGAKKNGYDLKKTEKLFDLIAEFAKYGFNKSHAVAYCVLATQTAWLKKYYPVEFFASLLSMEINNTDKIVLYARDAEKHGIKVLPPHINNSEYLFTPSGEQIYFSLGAIKGVGRSAVDHIVHVRSKLKGRNFISIQQFFEEVDIKKINKKCIEALVKAGAFDNMGLNRHEILFNYDNLLEQVDQKKAESESGQINLFSNNKNNIQEQTFIYVKKKEWPSSIQLKNEKSVIGFYLSGHPMDHLTPFIKVCGCEFIASFVKKEHKTSSRIWGIISDFREVQTRKGGQMAFARLEDGTDTIEAVFFSDVYLQFGQILRSIGEPVVLKGALSKEGNASSRILVQEVELVRHCLNSRSRGIILQLNEKEKYKFSILKEMFSQNTGNIPVYFNVKLENPSRLVCLKSHSFHGVNLSSQLLEQIQKEVGGQNRVQLY
ncbi:MAG: DNA polymerase III subunit alpha [Bdellovibrionales bacterium]|nr:DNA polymerase III subunit alpha [Bdellovibrionales bacterium]